MKEIKQEARKRISRLGLDPDYYLACELTGIRAYDLYSHEADKPQSNIMVRTEDGEIKELPELSGSIQALVNGDFKTHWLIYPAEAHEAMSELPIAVSRPPAVASSSLAQ